MLSWGWDLPLHRHLSATTHSSRLPQLCQKWPWERFKVKQDNYSLTHRLCFTPRGSSVRLSVPAWHRSVLTTLLFEALWKRQVGPGLATGDGGDGQA